jgi:hypothetical protein
VEPSTVTSSFVEPPDYSEKTIVSPTCRPWASSKPFPTSLTIGAADIAPSSDGGPDYDAIRQKVSDALEGNAIALAASAGGAAVPPAIDRMNMVSATSLAPALGSARRTARASCRTASAFAGSRC